MSAPVWPIYRAMVGVGLLSGVLIVTVFQATQPRIERNRAAILERAILQVLPQAQSSRAFRLSLDQRFAAADDSSSGRDEIIHAGYDRNGRFVGVALQAAGMGYQDVISVLYGYSFDQEQVVGMRVLASKETPGLGDKIASDPQFLANFEQLDVALADGGDRLAHTVTAVKHGTKQQPWQIDGITGATISSVAIAGIVDRSVTHWAPRLRGRQQDFEVTP